MSGYSPKTMTYPARYVHFNILSHITVKMSARASAFAKGLHIPSTSSYHHPHPAHCSLLYAPLWDIKQLVHTICSSSFWLVMEEAAARNISRLVEQHRTFYGSL